MREPIAVAVAALVAASPVAAAPGVTTTDVNFRAGPGTGYESLGVLPADTPVDIVECDAPREDWCAVEIDDYSGFVAARYLDELSDAQTAPAAAPGDPSEAPLSEAEIDELVAPIALHPDALLSQVLVAATYPLDIVRAERWVRENEGLDPDERQAAAEAEGWDQSVATLAAGFPAVIGTLVADLDWTEMLGEAVLADSEAVLDGVQRQRARAQALGNLESNAAQIVSVDETAISIVPADPEIVYVPSYEPQVVYERPAAQAPTTTTVVQSEPGRSAAGALATGALAFTAGVAVANVFGNRWNDYWYGPPRIDWGGGSFYPRPGYRPPPPPGWRPPNRPGRPGGGISIGDDNTIIIGRPGRPGRPERPDRPGIGNGRPGEGIAGLRPGRPGRPSAGDRDRIAERLTRDGRGEGAFRPSEPRRAEARREIARRKGATPSTGERARRETRATVGTNRPAGRPDSAGLQSKLKARSSGGSEAVRPARSAKPSRSPAARKTTAFSGHGKSISQAKTAASRGKASQARAGSRTPQHRAAPQRVHKPAAKRPPVRKAAPKRTAFQRSSGPGRKVSSHSARGHKSMSRGRGGRGRR